MDGTTAEVGDIDAALHSLFRSLKQTRLRDYLRTAAEVDLDPADVAALNALYTAESSLRLTELAELLRVDAPAVTRKAQQLERAGLVSRTRDDQDARATRLQLTPAGSEMISRFLATRRAWIAALVADWPGAERAEFARLLHRFNDEVQRHLQELNAG
jgi:DNA-binding MarR family transcriptional regulator